MQRLNLKVIHKEGEIMLSIPRYYVDWFLVHSVYFKAEMTLKAIFRGFYKR